MSKKPDLDDLFKKLKDSEENDYPEFEERRKSFIRQILLSKFFWLIVFILFLIILCTLSQGNSVFFLYK